MPTLHIPQKNLHFEVEFGENLMKILIAAGLPVASSCFAEGVCAKCVVHIDPIGQAQKAEQETLVRNKKSDNLRLSCQVFVESDLTVTTTYW